MDKSFGERKRKYLHKKKFNQKKKKYHDHRNKAPRHKQTRNYVNSYINHNIYNRELLDEFFFPPLRPNSYTWWDVTPDKSKVFRITYL